MRPFVSVAIPTRNRAAMLADCLASLRAQSYAADRFEIVVVDDGSTDATVDVVLRHADGRAPQVRYVPRSHGGLNAARNAALEASRGDPICFVDDDVEIPPGWLTAIVDGVLQRPEAGCLGGPIRLKFEGRPPRICEMESWEWDGELDYGPDERLVEHVNGGNLAVRRWAVEAVGPFDVSLSGMGDESEWEARLRRAGISIAYLPRAWLWHRRTAAELRPLTLLRRRFRQGVGYVGYATVVGERIAIARTLGPIPFYVAHAVRRRCFGALLEIAKKLGLTWGVLHRRRRRAA